MAKLSSGVWGGEKKLKTIISTKHRVVKGKKLNILEGKAITMSVFAAQMYRKSSILAAAALKNGNKTLTLPA